MKQLMLFRDPDPLVGELPENWFLPAEWLEWDGILAHLAILSYLVPDKYLGRIQFDAMWGASYQAQLLNRSRGPNADDIETLEMYRVGCRQLEAVARTHQEKLAQKAARQAAMKRPPKNPSPGPARRPLPIPPVGLRSVS